MKSLYIKRGRIEIICAILSVSRKPSKKTNILYKCNLSHSQLERYLKYLISHSLLNSFMNNQKEYFQTTDKGIEFLEEYDRLTGFLKERQNNGIVNNNHNGSFYNQKAY